MLDISKFPVFETILVKDGRLCSPELHFERMQNTCMSLWGEFKHKDIFSTLKIPDQMQQGIIKLNIYYNKYISEIAFSNYIKKEIKSIENIEIQDSIDYKYKYTNRKNFEKILSESEADEVILIRNGFVTDTTKANIVFEKNGKMFTPDTYLLNGSMRQFLLKTKRIIEKPIREEEISDYEKMYFINAMNPIETAFVKNIR